MSAADRIAEIVCKLDCISDGLAESGIECGDLVEATEELHVLRLEIEREQFAGTVPA